FNLRYWLFVLTLLLYFLPLLPHFVHFPFPAFLVQVDIPFSYLIFLASLTWYPQANIYIPVPSISNEGLQDLDGRPDNLNNVKTTIYPSPSFLFVMPLYLYSTVLPLAVNVVLV